MKNDNPVPHPGIRSLRRLLQLAMIAAWIGIVLGCLGNIHWTLDLCSHFYVQFAATAFVGTLAWIGVLNRRILALAGTAWLTLLPSILWLYVERSSEVKSNEQPLRVVSCNVLSSNPNKTAVLEFLSESKADMVLLMEVNKEWSLAIKTLDQLYPHQFHEPREDNFGIVLISKRPWDKVELLRMDNSALPSIEALFTIGEKPLRFIGTHPLPPMGWDYSKQRNLHFVNLAKHTREAHSETSTLVVGDLNCTSWSPHFRTLLNDSQLCDSREGFGVQRSWPTSMKFSVLGAMRIPIDHALVSRDIKVVNRRVGPFIGSDHFPIIIDILL